MFETVTRSYSYKLVLRSAFIVLLGGVLTVVAIYFSLNRKPGFSYAQSFDVMAALRQELFHKSLLIYASTSFFIVVGIAFISLIYSHRVAGPLHRLGMAARRLAAGNLSERVKLRKDDVVHPLADDINSLATYYQDILETLERQVSELRERISAVPESRKGLPAGEARDAIRMMSEKIDEIKDTLSGIRV